MTIARFLSAASTHCTTCIAIKVWLTKKNKCLCHQIGCRPSSIVLFTVFRWAKLTGVWSSRFTFCRFTYSKISIILLWKRRNIFELRSMNRHTFRGPKKPSFVRQCCKGALEIGKKIFLNQTSRKYLCDFHNCWLKHSAENTPSKMTDNMWCWVTWNLNFI